MSGTILSIKTNYERETKRGERAVLNPRYNALGWLTTAKTGRDMEWALWGIHKSQMCKNAETHRRQKCKPQHKWKDTIGPSSSGKNCAKNFIQQDEEGAGRVFLLSFKVNAHDEFNSSYVLPVYCIGLAFLWIYSILNQRTAQVIDSIEQRITRRPVESPVAHRILKCKHYDDFNFADAADNFQMRHISFCPHNHDVKKATSPPVISWLCIPTDN